LLSSSLGAKAEKKSVCCQTEDSLTLDFEVSNSASRATLQPQTIEPDLSKYVLLEEHLKIVGDLQAAIDAQLAAARDQAAKERQLHGQVEELVRGNHRDERTGRMPQRIRKPRANSAGSRLRPVRRGEDCPYRPAE
jgi:hypothetical protein